MTIVLRHHCPEQLFMRFLGKACDALQVQSGQAFFQHDAYLKCISHTGRTLFYTLRKSTDKLECCGDRPGVYFDGFQQLFFLF